MKVDLPSFTMTIAGRAASAAAQLPVIDPATEREIALVPDAGPAELDAAVAAARAALPAWAEQPWTERQAVLAAMARTLMASQEELARLLTSEQGRPLARARSELAAAAWWLAETAKLALPDKVLQDDAQAYVAVRRAPVGVVAGLVPWNYPIVLAAWKIGPALLAGNTMVVKPSPFTPLTTLRLGELLRDVVPAGVLNFISGGDALGPLMTRHSGFDKLSFTGSTVTGRAVMRSAADRLKRVTLELGGNDAAIVMPDVDVPAVARELFWGAFVNSGQICIAAKRIYIHEAIYEPMKQAMVELAKNVRMGPGDQEGVELGPVQNRRQYERLVNLLEDCKRNGYQLLTGGELPQGPGLFFPVTLVDNPPESSRIVQEEPFGPILPLLKFSDVDDAIARANATDYGLGASVWCRDERRATAIAQRLDSGIVWVNEIQAVSPHKPLGGHKQSGLGVENGIEGLLEYTTVQTLSVKRVPA
jgi:acyl-CoA reductase-like NAD-dependent aldehyde dehydrogenase